MEMKKQRVHSQEPDLFIEPKNLFVDYRNEDILFHAPWSNSSGEIFSNDNLLTIEFTNIGNGVAKYVSIEVFFEKDYISELLKSDINNIFNLRTFLTDYGMHLFQYEYGDKNHKRSAHNFDLDFKDKFSFNYIGVETSRSFTLHKNFAEIFNIAMYLNGVNSDSDYIIPRLKLNLCYYDSFNNKYEKDVDIYIGTVNNQIFTEFDGFASSFSLDGFNRLPEKFIKLD